LLARPAMGFSMLPQSHPAVQVGLGLLSVAAGGLLGAFLLAIYATRARQADVLWAITLSTASMLALWMGSKRWIPFPLGEKIAWPWYSLFGAAISVSTGWLLSLRHR